MCRALVFVEAQRVWNATLPSNDFHDFGPALAAEVPPTTHDNFRELCRLFDPLVVLPSNCKSVVGHVGRIRCSPGTNVDGPRPTVAPVLAVPKPPL